MVKQTQATVQRLGARINAMRKQKKISIRQICDYCDISKATYVRIASGDSEVRIPVLKKICALLRVSLEELDNDPATASTSPLAVLNRLEVLVDTNTSLNHHLSHKLKIFQDELAIILQTTDNEGLRQIQQLSFGIDAAVTGQTDVAANYADKIMQALAKMGEWTFFEQYLAIDTMPLLDFNRVRKIYNQVAIPEFTENLLTTDYSRHLNRALLFYLTKAMATKNRQAIQSTITAIQEYKPTEDGLFYRLIVSLVEICSCHLTGKHDVARAHTAEFSMLIQYFERQNVATNYSWINVTVNDCFQTITTTRWEDIE